MLRQVKRELASGQLGRGPIYEGERDVAGHNLSEVTVVTTVIKDDDVVSQSVVEAGGSAKPWWLTIRGDSFEIAKFAHLEGPSMDGGCRSSPSA